MLILDSSKYFELFSKKHEWGKLNEAETSEFKLGVNFNVIRIFHVDDGFHDCDDSFHCHQK